MYVLEQAQDLLHCWPFPRQFGRTQIPDTETLLHFPIRMRFPSGSESRVDRVRAEAFPHQPPHQHNRLRRPGPTSQELHQHDPEAVHVRLGAAVAVFSASKAPKPEVRDPRLEVLGQQDVGGHKVAVHHRPGASVVEVRHPTSYPDGDAVAREPTHLLQRVQVEGVRLLPRVAAPVLHVGLPRRQLVQPPLQVAVGHELAQNQLLRP